MSGISPSPQIPIHTDYFASPCQLLSEKKASIPEEYVYIPQSNELEAKITELTEKIFIKIQKASEELKSRQVTYDASLIEKHRNEQKWIVAPRELVKLQYSPVPCAMETIFFIKANISKYLNANRISMFDGRTYIATQAPPTIDDQETFWRLCYNYPLVIDLRTDEDIEKNEKARELKPTYPPDHCQFNDVTIEGPIFQSLDLSTELQTSLYKVVDKVKEKAMEVMRIHCNSWIDGYGIEIKRLKNLIQKIEEQRKIKLTIPVIHCIAGMGRTGTLITAMILKQLSVQGKLKLENFEDDLVDLIMTGKRQRGINFVHTKCQVSTLVQYGLDLIYSKMS